MITSDSSHAINLTGKEQLLWQYLDYCINECHVTPSFDDMRTVTAPEQSKSIVVQRFNRLCKKGWASKERHKKRGGIKVWNPNS